MRDACESTDARDFRHLVGAAGPQAMINGGRLDAPGQGGLGEQQQRQTVGSSRHGDAEPGAIVADALGPDRRQPGTEAFDAFRPDRRALSYR